MARGHQKLQSQAKTQEKTAKLKKQQGHSATEQKKAAAKALVHACAICKVIRHNDSWWQVFSSNFQFSSPSIVSGSNARSEDIQAALRK